MARTASARALAGTIGAIVAACMVMAAEAPAATGDLLQKPGAAGCLSMAGFCSPVAAVNGPASIAVSPDGQNAYVANTDSDAVTILDRGGDGTLVQKPGQAGCKSDTGAGRCGDATALDLATSVAVSPDGDSVYVASETSDAVAVFDRTRDGRLIQKPGLLACISDDGDGPCADGTALDAPESVTVSSDGESVYVASSLSDSVAVFDRAGDGSLDQKSGTAGCISNTGAGPCADGTALDFANAVTVSPDGESAYVASVSSGAVTVFDRAEDGTLTQKPGTAACISETGAGRCREGAGFARPRSVTVSPDGLSVYAAASSSASVAVFDRTPNGRLIQKRTASGCISDDGAEPCADATGLGSPESVAVSPDGQSVYVASGSGDAVAAFDRAPNGSLAQKPGTAGCISDDGAGPCVDGASLRSNLALAISPDGLNVYVASWASEAITLFDREPVPPTQRGG